MALGDEFADRIPGRLVMRAEYGAEHPFWTERGELVDDGELSLPADLRQRVRQWAEGLWDLEEGTPEADAWERRGRGLHREVTTALGNRCEVRYDDHVEPGGARG